MRRGGDAHVIARQEALVASAATERELVDRPAPLWDYARATGLGSLVVCDSKNPNAKLIVLLVSPATGRAVLAVKVPTTDAAAQAVEVEARVLRDVAETSSAVSPTIPRIVGAVDFDGRRGIVTTALSGVPLRTSCLRWRHTARRATVDADFAAVERWVAALQRATAGNRGPLEMDAGVTARLVSRFPREAASSDVDSLAAIHARLRRDDTPRTAIHGDLWAGNVLMDGGDVSGVVDWEAGASRGEPVRDLARFALMYALFLDRRTRTGRPVPGHRQIRSGDWGAGVMYAVDGSGWFPTLFRAFLRRGLARLGASPLNWRDVALAGVAEVAALADDDDFARRHLDLFRALVASGRSRD